MITLSDLPIPYTLTPKADTLTSADLSVPYRLTAKAHAALGTGPAIPAAYCGCGYDDCPACADGAWACLRCGNAFFGTPPDDGLCGACHTAEQP